MRIIGGEFRSRKLKTIPGFAVRPTPDRLREALFNVLTPRITDKIFLDAYAGSGAVGIEALSRGAKQVILIEKRREALLVIRENLETLGIEKRVEVAQGSATRLLGNYGFDIAFIDPPYDRPKEYEEAMVLLGGHDCELVIAQHDSRQSLDEDYGRLRRVRVLRQGDNSLSFYEPHL